MKNTILTKPGYSVNIFIILTYLFAIFVLVLLISKSTGMFGGADNIVHYYIAKHAFSNPQFFFDHWGKPIFTTLSAPFAQLGINGLLFYNILLVVLTSWFGYKLCKLLNIKNAHLVIPFIIFTPIYFQIAQSMLTEISFSFVLVLSVFLFIRKNHWASAILLSFLPFIRTEAIVIFPVFILGYLYYRRYFSFLFLFTGFAVYSIAGGFFYGDFLWVIHQFPYRGAASIYNSGSLFHFVNHYNTILGLPLVILFIMGLYAVIKKCTWKRKLLNHDMMSYFIILGSAAAYFIAHSFAWWLGKGGSLGLIRVIAGITPLLVIVSLDGLNQILEWIKSQKVKYSVITIVLVLVIAFPFYKFTWPFKDKTSALLKESLQWFSNSKYSDHKVFFFNPFVPEYLGLDPFDQENSGWMIHFSNSNLTRIAENDIVIWDAHFGTNEGQTKLETLLDNPRFSKIASFYPEESFKVLGDNQYCIYYFKAASRYSKKFKDEASHKTTLGCNATCLKNLNTKITEITESNECIIHRDNEFINAFKIPVNEYMSGGIAHLETLVSYKTKPGETLTVADSAYLIATISKNNKNLVYLKENLLIDKSQDSLVTTKITYTLSVKEVKDGELFIYLWNLGSNAFMVKEIQLIIREL